MPMHGVGGFSLDSGWVGGEVCKLSGGIHTARSDTSDMTKWNHAGPAYFDAHVACLVQQCGVLLQWDFRIPVCFASHVALAWTGPKRDAALQSAECTMQTMGKKSESKNKTNTRSQKQQTTKKGKQHVSCD